MALRPAAAFLRGSPSLRAAVAACERRSWLSTPRPASAAAAVGSAAAAAAAAGGGCFSVQEGTPGREGFRISFRRADGRLCSPWHHIEPFSQRAAGEPRCRRLEPRADKAESSQLDSSPPPQLPPYRTAAAAAAASRAATAAAAAAAPAPAADEAAATAAGEDFLIRYVAEIECGSAAKNEIMTGKPWNPIEQDRNEDGSPRVLRWPMEWSYGSIPQTWADPRLRGGPEVFGLGGDDDPLDVVEVTQQQHKPGEIVAAKVLGGLCLIDSGEVDLKVLVVSLASPLFPLLSSPADLEAVRPGFLHALKAWFANYKDPARPNDFGCKGEPLGPRETWALIAQAHQSYRRLLSSGHAAPPHLWLPRGDQQ
ncbi:hypothetical protein Efla_000940 [Eimeria flavescens]